MLRFGIVACAVCALLAVGCGKKNGEGTSSTNSTAPSSSGQALTPEQAASVVDALKSMVPQPESVPEESSPAPEPYTPSAAEDESKTPRLTVDQILSNPALIDRKYSMREIELSGVVTKSGADESAGGAETIWVGSAGNKAESSIACRVRGGSSVGKPTAGSNIVIRGRLARNMAQSLEDCEAVVGQ